jgi:radical SAM superfamily enzyme YgiQ (UPF0313 family)
MKVLFVYPNTVRHPKDISLGIAYLSSVLKQHGHETVLVDTTFGMKEGEVLSRFRKSNPDLIAVSSVSNNFPYATHLAAAMKKEKGIPILLGGIHATVAPEESIMKDCIDMICIGEGEDAILELVQSMEKDERNTTIPNIWFKENGRIIKNPLRPLREDLDSIPHADLNIYDFPRYLENHNMVASLMGSRGCPYKCTYCINHTLKELYGGLGKFSRFRSVDNIISEIKNIIQDFNPQSFCLYDDTFTLDKKRIKEFCRKYKNEIGLPFSVNARVESLSDGMLDALSRSGCTRVSIGLEAGDPKIRKEVLKRNISDKQIIEGCHLIKKYGLELYTYNMIGIPEENMKSIRKTIELNRKVKPDYLIASIFTAYKGTELYEKCKNEGLLTDEIPSHSYYTGSNVNHPSFPAWRLRHLRKWFGFHVFIKYNIKRAFIELFDRYLIMNRFYSRFRSLYANKVMQYFKMKEKPS